jgi:carbamoyltransferase
MITWGISANSHDAALAVFKHGIKGLTSKKDLKLVFASHSERFSGIKNDAHLDDTLINYARQWGEPNEVVWYEKSFRKTLRQLRAGQGWNYNENNIKKYLRGYGISAPIKYSSHHHSHAAAGYYTSKFTNATVICIDSIGEFETLSVWDASNDSMKRVYSQGYPHSIGLWYSAMTQRIGLKPNEDEYILMGMAAYGNPKRLFLDILNDFINKDGIGYSPKTGMKHNLHQGCMWWRPELTSEQDMYDIAAATQKVYEYLLENILIWASKNTPSRNLVLMGGCALNCSANALAYKYFNNVWIMPNPGDAGSAIGSVLAHYKQKIKWPGPYLGYNIEGEYPVEKILAELRKTGICGVASGRAEFGPRALGNRSLLADPRGGAIKDQVNDIKQRQRFRPFAPVVLAEHASNYFDGHTGPYMQFTSYCKQPDQFPAITHVDGTSRVQAVEPDGSGIRKLLEAWYAATGCPMLLNTSLNIKGKPMVNNKHDAQMFEQEYGVLVFTDSV